MLKQAYGEEVFSRTRTFVRFCRLRASYVCVEDARWMDAFRVLCTPETFEKVREDATRIADSNSRQ